MVGASHEATEALKKACEKVSNSYASMGADADDLSSRIVNSFEAAFDRPPVEEFEMILQRNFSKDEVRVCMFAPKEDQIKYYPALMTAANATEIDKLEKDHPLKKLKPLMLSLVFLLHRHSWKDFMEEFIVRGGLDILATMLAEPNLYYRGQVVEIMITATDSDVFDWFEPKTDIMSRTLHIRLLELSEHPSFLNNILANRLGSYPGGSMRCLTLLAFWLSWVRAMYTKDQVLQLSPKIVTELKKWGREVGRDEEGNIDLSDVGDAADDVVELSGDDNVNEGGEEDGNIREEKKLVRTLLKDFTVDQFKDKPGYALESQTDSVSAMNSSEVTGIVRPAEDEIVKEKVKEVFSRIDDDKILAFSSKIKVDTAKPSPDAPSVPRALPQALKVMNSMELKAEGNRLFGNGDYLAALTAYDEALASVDVEGEDEELLATLHFNRAACYWKVACFVVPHLTGLDKTRKSKAEVDEETQKYMLAALRKEGGFSAGAVEELAKCETACRACLSLNKRHYKSAYRLAATLLAQSKPEEALDVVENTLGSMKACQNSLSATEMVTFASLQELRTRCLAACIVESNAKEGLQGTPSLPLSSSRSMMTGGRLSGQTAKILTALQRRQDRERNKEVHAEGSAPWSAPLDTEDTPVGADRDATKDVKGRDGTGTLSSYKKTAADVSVEEYFGPSNVYTGGADTTDTSMDTAKSNKPKKVSKPIVSSNDEEAVAKKARADARKAAKLALSEAISRVRIASAMMEKTSFSLETVIEQSAEIISALKAIKTAKRTGKYCLAQGFKDGSFLLEEGTLIGCLLAFANSPEPPTSWYPLLTELCACERFGSVLGMAKFGNEPLKLALSKLMEKGDGIAGEEEVRRALAV